MALLKKCRCGMNIPYMDKGCPECIVEMDKNTKDRYKKYSMYRNDKREQKFYNSNEWKEKRLKVISFYNGIDIYELYTTGNVIPGHTVHHIIPLKDEWNKRLVTRNLIYLSEENHKKVHMMLRDDYKGTIKLLDDMITRWINEYV